MMKNNFLKEILLTKELSINLELSAKTLIVLFFWYVTLYWSFSNSISSKKFSKPFIEPEIALRVKEDIDISKAPFSINNIDDSSSDTVFNKPCKLLLSLIHI